MKDPRAVAARQARKTRAWQRARAHVVATQTVCWICGRPVDKTLPGRHPLGPSADHVHPLGRGGPLLDPANLRLAHLRCNSSKKDRVIVRQTTSRNW